MGIKRFGERSDQDLKSSLIIMIMCCFFLSAITTCSLTLPPFIAIVSDKMSCLSVYFISFYGATAYFFLHAVLSNYKT